MAAYIIILKSGIIFRMKEKPTFNDKGLMKEQHIEVNTKNNLLINSSTDFSLYI